MENQRILAEIAVQLLGFGAVFLLLKKLAWGNLMGSLEARRKAIDEGFKDIERRKHAADEMEKEYKRRLDTIEQEARVKIQEAASIGQTLARDIQEKARKDSDKMIERAKEEIRQDLDKARVTMRNDLVEVSSLMTEKILREKVDQAQHGKLVDRFLKELERVN